MTAFLGRCLPAFLVACLTGIAALGVATLPDQLSLPGIYNAGDDDPLGRLAGIAAVGAQPSPSLEPTYVVVSGVPSPPAAAHAVTSTAGSHLRSPPIA